MATRARTKRAQSVASEDNVPRPAKRGRQQHEIVEEQPPQDDDFADSDDEQLDQEDAEDTGRQEALRFSGRATVESSDEGTEVRRQYIEHALPELSTQADKVIAYFSQPIEERQKESNQHLFVLHSRHFHGLREPIEEPMGYPFIDSERLEKVIQFTGPQVRQVGYVNLATALDLIEKIISDDATDEDNASTGSSDSDSALGYLKELDDFLHKLYNPFNYGDQLDISLNIRTILFIKRLREEIDKSKTAIRMPKVQELVASYFIDPSALGPKINIPSLFINGPFKILSHNEVEDPDTMCEARLARITSILKKSAKGAYLTDLQEEFPLAEKLEDLRNHILSVCEISKKDAQPISQTQQQEFHDAREDLEVEDDLESITDSQPIVRASGNGVSLYTGPESLKYLSHDAAPTSGQHATIDDSNSVILGPRPASATPSTGTGHSASVIPHRSRENIAEETPIPEEDEDPFEEDQRPVDKKKAAEVRQQLNSRRPLPTSSTMPPPPRPSAHQSSAVPESSSGGGHESTPPPSSAFDVMRSLKARLAAESRTPYNAPPINQRHKWSDHDTYLLIDLVAKCHGSWTNVSKAGEGKWDHPRNQTAYRDKARNLKVDFLLTGKLLPPCFDLVALGPKEVDKVMSMGKNPYRKEKDMDDDGNAINTELPREEE